MTTPSPIVPTVVLALCGVALVSGLVCALVRPDGMPLALLLAVPALIVGRWAWQRIRPPATGPRR